MNLLLVNDIVLETETMKREIDWASCGISEVFTAYNAESAKQVIETHDIDIILCDIEMPGENGLSLIQWIIDHHYDIDCILLTCHADFSYARTGLSLGCQDYILLPAKYEEISSSVLRVHDRRVVRLNDKRLSDYGKSWLNDQSDAIAASSPHQTPQQITDFCTGYILSHLDDESLSVTDLASKLYLNPIHLNRIFKKERGMNISQYMIKERMELASTLLKTTRNTVGEIALRVGYSNYPYFSTVFKKHFGCTPSQYIEANRKAE